MPRHSLWQYSEDGRAPVPVCHGAYLRWMCNFGTGDLPALEATSSGAAFVNKFSLEVDPLAPVCWTEQVLLEQNAKN